MSKRPLRVYKPEIKDPSGKKSLSAKWYVDFYDHKKRRHKIAGFTAKRPTDKLAENLEALISSRVSGQCLTPELQTWIDHLPDTLVQNLVRWGLLDGQRSHTGKPLVEHLQDWRQDILARGRTLSYANEQHNRVWSIFVKAGFNFFGDIKASKLQQEISKLQRTVRTRDENGKLVKKVVSEALSTTRNYYASACQAFCRWLQKDGRISQNPLENLSPADDKAQSEERAALEPDEVARLLAYTETAGVSYGLTGHQRTMLYLAASETGFRSNELRSLRVSDFDFGSAYVTLSGRHTKNSKDASIPLRPATAEKLKAFFGSKLPQAPAFKLPCKTNVARMYRKDLAAAGIEIEADRGMVDFHGLRHTFGSLLGAAGTPLRDAQQLMRHSTPVLTARYIHVYRGREAAAINSLPDYDRLAESQQQKATGTDNKPVDGQNLLPRLLPKTCAEPGLTATNLDGMMVQGTSGIGPVSESKSANLSQEQGFSDVSARSSVG